MTTNSLWTHTASLPIFPALEGDERTDVLIVGGGIAGLLCARLLTNSGINCILLEGASIASGTTANTTAKITAQHGLIYDHLIQSLGIERAQQYYEANRRAIETFRDLATNLPCDMEEKPAFTYSLTNQTEIEREVAAALRLGAPASFAQTVPLPLDVQAAIRFDNQLQFHPLKFLAGLTNDLHIYEHSFVRAIRGTTAHTERGSVTAKAIVIATHFPILNCVGGYFLKMYQHRSYVLAFENAPGINGMYLDAAENGLSFRNHENFLLIGGGDHRTGKHGGGWSELRNFAAHHYPTTTEIYHWAAQDCMTLDDIPYIGRYSTATQNIYVATGFNKWGMTGSMVSAMLLSDLLSGTQNDCANVFLPSRSMLNVQLFINSFESTVNLLNPSPRRCTHLGCALQWNSAEHSWDCPCHGSRFDAHGNILENPAMRRLDP